MKRVTDSPPTPAGRPSGDRLPTVVAGPACAATSADFGADVIKVERPGAATRAGHGLAGPARRRDALLEAAQPQQAHASSSTSRTRATWTLAPPVADADVLIENLRPGKLEALGFGCDDLLPPIPGFVTRVTGFGQDGPYAEHPGFATIAEALSGFSSLLGEPEGGPLLPPIALTDEVTGAGRRLHHPGGPALRARAR